jgi:hypothetical protein
MRLAHKKIIGMFIIPASLIIPLLIVLVIKSDIPLGLKGQWLWPRNSQYVIPFAQWGLICIPATIALGSAYLLDFKFKRTLKVTLPIMCLIVTASMTVDIFTLQSGRVGSDENIIAIVDQYTTGYLHASENIKTPGRYFIDFTKKQLNAGTYNNRPRDIHHIHVHPPGNTLLSLGILLASKTTSIPKKICDLILPEKAGLLNKLNFTPVQYPAYYYYAACTIFMLFVISIPLGKALLIASLFILSKNKFRYPGMASALICFAAPGPILFLGHYDSFLFFLTSLWLFFFVLSFHKYPISGGLLTGIILAAGVFFTLAYGSLLLLTYLILVTMLLRKESSLTPLIAVTAGGISVIIFAAAFHINIINICIKCMENNTIFHAAVKRTIGWALYNPIECLFFIGPLTCLGMLGAAAKFNFKKFKKSCHPELLLPAVTTLILLILCLTPFSRGEFGRLIQYFTPIPLFITSYFIFKRKIPHRYYNLLILSIFLSILQTFIIRTVLMLVVIS